MSGKLKADTTNNYAYNKILQPFANKLRKEMTKAEACLWKYALAGSGLQPEPMFGFAHDLELFLRFIAIRNILVQVTNLNPRRGIKTGD